MEINHPPGDVLLHGGPPVQGDPEIMGTCGEVGRPDKIPSGNLT